MMAESLRLLGTYPPPLNVTQLARLTEHFKDYQLTHGSIIKLIRTSNEHSILSRPIGVSLFPSIFPRPCFEAAVALQQSYNLLYATVACNETWLQEVLHDLIEHDEFAATLWDIHQKTKMDRQSRKQFELGIFRSDYMLQDVHHLESQEESKKSPAGPQLKQVEFNTYSCAGGTHGNIISNLHRLLTKQGVFETVTGIAHSADPVMLTNLPPNETVKEIAAALARAYNVYVSRSIADYKVSGSCILMVVQPDNINICDERPLEYELWEMQPCVPTFRVEFGDEVLSKTMLKENGKLLYQVDPSSKAWEVAVVYMRAGYEPEEYTEAGVACRLRLESSIAIKSPGILTHLCTFKKIQQALTDPSAISRFMRPEQAAAISATFAPMYPLDTSRKGQLARKIVLDPELASRYILKPSLEGGGHNVYGTEISTAIASISETLWPNYVLMETIEPPRGVCNILMTPNGLYDGPVKSELGIFGICMWQQDENGQPNILENINAGWSLKTKAAIVDEMSVIKGYGAFDSPCLVDLDLFSKLTRIE